ncbi:MAG TPA: tyrosine-type recombinase/integrase [Phycisphaerae bacterium]|nr:tyrosine-type recombinase/integrase [Phycisphaerae bacterium]HUU97956.1 tyrosine-type recombinase/integrase [Phycisphaerae bacterium]
MATTALLPARPVSIDALPACERDSLTAWLNLYMGLEAGANADNTIAAKTRDLRAFLGFFAEATGCDQADLWTRSITSDFLKTLQRDRRSPTTINRILATLRHCAAWIHRQRPFLAGNPMERITDIAVDDPEWKGLEDIEVTRLKAAAEQLIHLKRRRNQQPIRDYAIFHVLLRTGLRVSELLRLDLDQYQVKHLVNVKRKGRKVSRQVFLAADAREALDRYIEEVRGCEAGPLLRSRSGKRLARQNVDAALKAIANQANARFPNDQKIKLHAHVLRHTCLRKVAEKHGVQYAMELSGQSSERYIWRYVQPSSAQKEAALDDLF